MRSISAEIVEARVGVVSGGACVTGTGEAPLVLDDVGRPVSACSGRVAREGPGERPAVLTLAAHAGCARACVWRR